MKYFLRWLLVCGLTITAAAQNQKISQLPSGSPAVSTDLFPIARSGANYSLPISAITYTLPAATSSTLGGVEPDGTSIVNSSGAISVTPTSIGLSNVTNNAQVTGVTAGTGLTGGGTGGSLTLNVNWAAPGAGLGSTTPQSGAFTTLSATSGVTATSVTISSKCAANSSSGTVACGTAPSGSFSCDTSTSAGTCVIDTSAVAAGSAIWVQPDASLGSLLSVTCNTTADTGLTAPRLSARSAGSSFTINVGTFTTHPMCFSYGVN